MTSLAPFSSMPWTPGGHPLEQKKATDGGLTLLEFAPGFEDPNWCGHGHVLYVLEGTLGFELEGAEPLTVKADEGCRIAAGQPHRARNAGDTTVRLFIWSDPPPRS